MSNWRIFVVRTVNNAYWDDINIYLLFSLQNLIPQEAVTFSYAPVFTRELHLQQIGIGVNLGPGTEEEQQVRIAKRIGLIQHLPMREYDGTKKGECVICMMELQVGEEVRYLPCMHTYHAVCIDDWLLRSLTCPSCMEPVDAALISSYHPTT